jgi:Tol biopolymer transport system component
VQSISSGTRTTIVNGGGDARYLSTGHLLYSQGGIVYAVPFDPGRPAITGGAVRVVEGVRRAEAAQSGAAQLATSATGTLAYVPGPVGSTSIERAVAVADRTGAVTRLTLPLRPYVHVRASRDGKRIAFDSDDGKQAIVWTHELTGTGAPARLTFAGRNRFPVWAPDGQRVAFQSDREGDLAIFVQRVDGTGQTERLTKPEKGDVHVPESWSPDGRHISFSVIKGSSSSLWTVSVDDKKAAPFGDVHSTESIGSVFSPDGHWIAYYSRADNAGPSGSNSPSTGVYVQPFPATGARYQAPKLQIDFQPIWSPDGSELIYVPLAASGQMAAVRLSKTSGITAGRPHLFPAAVTAGRTSGLTRAFDILPDGRFIGLVSGSEDSVAVASSSEIRVVLNWHDELKRLVPTN